MKKYTALILLFLTVSVFASEIEKKQIIPDLKVKLMDGQKVTIHELLKDGPLLIDFWATWCKPCKKVMKHLNQYHLDYANKGFKVLMINQDSPRSMGKVKTFIRSKKFDFLIGLDPNQKLAKKLNGLIMPTLILVAQDGTIQWRHQGYMPGEEKEIEYQIRLLLGLESESLENNKL
ncbi:MAG: TlpA family protein disulfide reductase [Candidatus Marinimicrobia bacterium]|jgi:thiol-disulfide isomerase/thioredoxin|nr:TlpA family protein disulfide reductase [Candidatus Neomarinimicrobiota bacterium]MBT3838491.1 TlpA family protein disulfide reductase [Candidatus Neomarinimicrobiota bacterium]MBT3961427.1 TlpA family protein disulfide reductase [Candidatus Neomarinimicrobiota bacterium]MBT4282909.1 TlpA family protein disulfide reductase [Candidatus Neomarinimicrobiota bacterium]MBT4635847.1 TlpA family protein disulfide reductase [Candidatus Neomarinimicrobiota bacterium]